MNYQQLTEGKRYQISVLLEQEMSVSNIASTIKCYKATVYRELKCNINALKDHVHTITADNDREFAHLMILLKHWARKCILPILIALGYEVLTK